MTGLAALAAEEFAYLTTLGRVSGHPHEIEIWFAVSDGCVWMPSLRVVPDARV